MGLIENQRECQKLSTYRRKKELKVKV